MNWPLAIVAILLGVLSLANLKVDNVQYADTWAEALHVMGKLRGALQRCEATKRQAHFEAPAPAPAPEPTPALDSAKRYNEPEAPASAPAQTPAFDDATRLAGLDAPSPAPAQVPTLDDARRSTIAFDARPHSVALAPKEAERRECGLEAERLGRTAALWCAGL